MSLVFALIFAFNIFAVVPMAENHANADGMDHFMIAENDDLSNSTEKTRHGHIEKCGVASCSIAHPELQNDTAAFSGTKTSFAITPSQHVSLNHFPPERPPKA